ncbi:cupin domain-containing protein [Nonomuraea jiangxiensis]|uniref:Mannose-6-phosphate isomerase, cupin superfamily n=1 Tax=Nonomuraea jiangxiensis TaxID=633440 RepID=A0A1G9R291_9ACTN|nr:cupin domain-containing protein [Nonomuraea jiangxiensis]SDM17364.1 Mannose-6-phosphate isomerase, cupin superfamily [Nonomuraea jiangxiensis]
MSMLSPGYGDTVVVRAAEAEKLGVPPNTMRLIADGDVTSHALGTHLISLGPGTDGAPPHHHDRSSELFFVVDGSVDLLCGEELVTAERHDVVIVPPRTPHAFGASAGRTAELLVVVAPGVERFPYFRGLFELATGTGSLEQVLEIGRRCDTFIADASGWQALRAASREERR